MAADRGVTIYIDPPTPHFYRNRLFVVNDPRFRNGDCVLAPYAYLREYFSRRGIPVQTADYLPREAGPRRNIYVSLGILANGPRLSRRPDTTVSAYFALECPIVDPSLYRSLHGAQRHFKRIFSWSDSASLEPFVGAPLQCRQFWWPQAFAEVHEEIWRRTDRKFLVAITAHKRPRDYRQELYVERERAIAFFSQTDDIDLYGPGWDGPPYRQRLGRLPGTAQHALRALENRWDHIHPNPLLQAVRGVYRGIATSKSETLGQYTFCLCFENMILKGWITEKIFDCFYAGTIPIYLGAPDVETYIHPASFIDMRRFASYADLLVFLKSLSLDQIRAYKERAREYLGSTQARPFTKEAFVDIFRQIVREDAGLEVA